MSNQVGFRADQVYNYSINYYGQNAYYTSYGPDPRHPAFMAGQFLREVIVGTYDVASNFFKSLNDFFSIPGVGASSIDPSQNAVGSCSIPKGPYLNTCDHPEITRSSSMGDDAPLELCFLRTKCEKAGSLARIVDNQFHYKPSLSLILQNIDGRLTIMSEWRKEVAPPICSSGEEANQELGRLSEEELKIDHAFATVLTDQERRILHLQKEEVNRKKRGIIGELEPGTVIACNKNGVEIITPENKNNHLEFVREEDYKAFNEIATSTGGIMGISHHPKFLSSVISQMFESMRRKITPGKHGMDLVLAIDTTESMSPKIENVKDNLSMLMDRLQQIKIEDNLPFRIAIIEYRDKTDTFINRINSDFTNDLEKLKKVINNLHAWGGGDIPEAVLDVLLKAKEGLSWDKNANRFIILIGDAGPHPKTEDDLYDQNDVLNQLQEEGIKTVVFPILTG